jgi:hypothetical protein
MAPHLQDADKCPKCGNADLALIGRYLDGENRRRKAQHWVYRCLACGRESKEITFRTELVTEAR